MFSFAKEQRSKRTHKGLSVAMVKEDKYSSSSHQGRDCVDQTLISSESSEIDRSAMMMKIIISWSKRVAGYWSWLRQRYFWLWNDCTVSTEDMALLDNFVSWLALLKPALVLKIHFTTQFSSCFQVSLSLLSIAIAPTDLSIEYKILSQDLCQIP